MEVFERYQKDIHGILGAKIIDICIGKISRKKGILVETKGGEIFHIEAKGNNNLIIAKQIYYPNLKQYANKNRKSAKEVKNNER